VNCQLYSSWRLGKRKPGIGSDGEGLVEAVGESIEVRGVGLCWAVGVGAGMVDSPSVVDLLDKSFREEAVGFGEGGSRYVGEGGGYALGEGVAGGVGSGSEQSS